MSRRYPHIRGDDDEIDEVFRVLREERRTMPTKAATGTKHMKTTAKSEPAEVDPQEGHYRRRNWTDDNGKRHTEELRPGSKGWVEVEVH